MKKLNGFQIDRLTMSGFKCFAEETSFAFGGTSFVTGHNGGGKSSIADAIAFAVTGLPFFGDRSRGHLEHPNCGAAEVVMDFTDDQGAARRLTRRRKGGRSAITLDTYNVRQADLNEIFGEKDLFLSMLNPLYFIEVLAEDGKQLLEKLLPAIPHEHTLAAMSEHMRSLLEGESMLSPETYLQNRRAEIRQLEESLIYWQGRGDQLTAQRAQKLGRLAELRQRADETGRTAEDTAGLSEGIRALESERARRQAESYQSQFIGTVAGLEAELKTLYAEHAKLTKLTQASGRTCPTCLQVIKNTDAIRDSLKTIVDKGKNLKLQLSEARSLDTQAKEVFEQFKADDLTGLDAELSELRAKDKHSEHLLEEIDELERWLEQNPDDTQARTDEIRTQIHEKSERIQAAAAYIAKRAELTFACLTMNKVKLSLMEVVPSTGEVRDTFKFTYEGRLYRWLSLSEKIRAGLEISELLKRLSGRRYPTFIDNGESVTVIDNIKPSGQILFAKVVHGAPLTVTVKEQNSAPRAA